MKSVNRLLLLPTDDTLAYLQSMFASGPLHIEWERIYVELGSSLSPIVEKPETCEYHAIPGGMNVWYDDHSACSNLLIPLFPSKKMFSRHQQVGDAWHRTQFRPVMHLGPTQVLKRNHRGFINSIATALVDVSPVFSFRPETVNTEQMISPENGNYYQDSIARGMVSNQVMLETDEGIE